jgi:hypothetical protein
VEWYSLLNVALPKSINRILVDRKIFFVLGAPARTLNFASDHVDEVDKSFTDFSIDQSVNWYHIVRMIHKEDVFRLQISMY